MILKKGVYYFKTPRYIYVRDTTTRMDYIFNDIAYCILAFLRENECSFDSLFAYLCTQYSMDNVETSKNDILRFVETLVQKGLIVEKRPNDILDRRKRIKDAIKRDYADNHRLMFATLELTYLCNERCIHCYVDDAVVTATELQLDEYKVVIDQLSEMGCISVLLTGGECTLRKDFLDIASYIVRKGMLLDIFTNGFNLTDEVIDKLIEIKPNSISFSLYAGEARVHDSITKVMGSFERSLRNLMIFKCAGIDTYIKSVVMKQNYSVVESLIRLAKRLNVELLLGTQIADSHCGKDADQFRLMCEEDYLHVFELEMEYYPNHLAHPSQEKKTICATGKNQLSINPYGDVYPCNAFPTPIGNIRNSSIQELWLSAPLLRRIQDYTYDDLSPRCGTCEHKPWCFVCLGAALRENKNNLAPCSDTCMLARASHRIFEMKACK